MYTNDVILKIPYFKLVSFNNGNNDNSFRKLCSFEHCASSNRTDQEALKYRALTIKNATSGDKESAIEKGHKLL